MNKGRATAVIAVQGCGRTGSALAAALVELLPMARVVLVDPVPSRAELVAVSLGERVQSVRSDSADLSGVDLLVTALPAGANLAAAQHALDEGVPVVSVADAAAEVRGLYDLDAEAASRGVAVVAGAGMTPGLSCLLVRHGSLTLDRVDEIHIAKAGTGGAACARNHHAALTERALDWREGGWVQQRGGSGRQLAHFPEPVGPRDCYRAGMAEAMVLHRCFPSARRITARVAATRRDRLTANLPMLRPPHLDGGPGAIRVELWGRRNGAVEVLVYGASGAPSRVAGAMAAVTVSLSLAGEFPPGVRSLAEVDDSAAVLAALAGLGVTVSVFEGAK